MQIPNNTIEYLKSERAKQTPPYQKFYDEAIEALEQVNSFQNGNSCGAEGGTFQNGNDHAKDKWISVEDSPPKCSDDKGVEVIAFIKGEKESTVLYYCDGEFFNEDGFYNVTHWMPMPEPPENEKRRN